jgi:predicted GIY-YIG superfamily endonuclease
MGAGNGFSKKYSLSILVYMEQYRFITEAIAREKQLKA